MVPTDSLTLAALRGSALGAGGGQVLMATNRPDTLDPALLRPGRLDRKVEFGLPDLESRAQIFQIHTRTMNCERDIRYELLARRGPPCRPRPALPRLVSSCRPLLGPHLMPCSACNAVEGPSVSPVHRLASAQESGCHALPSCGWVRSNIDLLDRGGFAAVQVMSQ